MKVLQHQKLKVAYNKYLPTVLNESVKTSNTKTLNESQKTEITGNKATPAEQSESDAEIINLRKLAGYRIKLGVYQNVTKTYLKIGT